MAWSDDPNRLRLPQSQISEIEARIRAIPANQRSYYQLQQVGISIPPGYRLEKDGRLKYVAVSNQQNWYTDPKVMIPAVLGGGYAAGSLFGGAAGAAGGAGAESGVGAYGTGAGLNAAQAGAAYHAGSPLLGAGTLAGLGAGAIPTIASRQIGNGMGTDPTPIGPGSINGAELVWDAATQSWVKKAASAIGNAAGDAAKAAAGGIPDWLGPILASLAGLPGLLAAKQGPSDEEKAYQAQATRLLKQQEQRTQFQNPLYETITRMAYGLQPRLGGNDGSPYPINSLNDVQIP